MSDRQTRIKINDLVQSLHELRLQREEISQQEDAIQTELLFLSSEHETDISEVTSRLPPEIPDTIVPDTTITSTETQRDREGNVIEIGDTVKFLTPSKFKGSQGVVTSFSPSRVTSTTKYHRKVSKTSRNLSIIKKKSDEF